MCKNLPVEQVSWNDAQEFITALNKIDSKGYRLPTEAEWEYTVRGGHTGKDKPYTVYSFGDRAGDISKHAWRSANSGRLTQPVGTKNPLKIGEAELFDMHGNVWEWVQDRYGAYPTVAVTDPTGPETGSFRVIRSGSWSSLTSDCRSAKRSFWATGALSNDVGFRLVKVLQ